jgi:hypothetical protein
VVERIRDLIREPHRMLYPDTSFDDPFGRFLLVVGLVAFTYLLVVQPQVLDQWGNVALATAQAHLGALLPFRLPAPII